MPPTRRRSLHPSERRFSAPYHPVGRARRRWPGDRDPYTVAYEGRHVHPRYHRVYDGGRPAERRRRVRTPLQRMRESPVRSGLIGLAIAGAAAPIAVNRYQTALRTDPAHERMLLTQRARSMADEAMLSDTWRSMEASRRAVVDREVTVAQNVERHHEYNLSQELAEAIYDAATEVDVDPDLAYNLVRAESSFRNTSTSSVGAVGLTQLMPKTAAWLAPGTTTRDLRNPETNLRIGFKYLRQLIDKYEGDTDLALLAYNRGPGTVDRLLKRGGNPDNGYADFVNGKANHGHSLFSNS